MADLTTIQIEKVTLEQLRLIKDSPRQTYDELIRKLVSLRKNLGARMERDEDYEKFMYAVQAESMRDLWDNPIDNEIWG